MVTKITQADNFQIIHNVFIDMKTNNEVPNT